MKFCANIFYIVGGILFLLARFSILIGVGFFLYDWVQGVEMSNAAWGGFIIIVKLIVAGSIGGIIFCFLGKVAELSA